MKKLLSVLATIGVVSSSSVSVIACGTKETKNNNQSKKDITQIVQDFQKDVEKIWTKHYEKEVLGNLIGVESMEEDNEFLNKYNIQKFSKPENKDKLTIENKKQLTNDIEKLFNAKLLREKIDALKKVTKYKIILDEVSSVFEHVELVFNNNFQINSGEIAPGSYIGNVIVDYKVVTQYMGMNNIEKFKKSGTLKYTSTDSKSFKEVGDVMYKNIAKDMFISQETQKYVNLKWSDIKNNSSDSKAYVNSNSQLKKYYNENESFHNSLLKTINDKYFKAQFPSIDISYNKKSIYKTNNFAKENKNYLIVNNFYESDEDIKSFDLSNTKEYEMTRKMLLNNNEELNKFFLDTQFNRANWSKIRSNYKIAQNSFLTSFLNQSEIYEYQKTKNYDLGVAMGYVEFIGPSIKIGKDESFYNHELPDFKLAISYSINGINDEHNQSLSEFCLELFNVYKELYMPKEEESHSQRKWLFDLWFYKYEIWKPTNNTQIRSVRDVNNTLLNFNNSYYKNKEKHLNKFNLSSNSFKEENIYFSFNMTKEFDQEIQKPIKFVFQENEVLNDGFVFVDSLYSSSKSLKTYDYMILNLFGVVKVKIKFDRNYNIGGSQFVIF
ncbi:lipoprotein [Spiroplasma floricola]|uniref:Lipoprotein n=1 Tax=Spiroplasma floricola 23-6 TaxID=1336749 RepID=A0A2K8SER6_9MOLU|nr:lipoprotein [Spiroplasma floricola]AUB31748.1 hypothetical protein SFLOR_v1c07000 [Spiroplasma floricola 23-6]